MSRKMKKEKYNEHNQESGTEIRRSTRKRKLRKDFDLDFDYEYTSNLPEFNDKFTTQKLNQNNNNNIVDEELPINWRTIVPSTSTRQFAKLNLDVEQMDSHGIIQAHYESLDNRMKSIAEEYYGIPPNRSVPHRTVPFIGHAKYSFIESDDEAVVKIVENMVNIVSRMCT